MRLKKWTSGKKIYKVKKNGGENMATMTTSNNIFEFVMPKSKLKSLLKKIEEPGLTKEYLEECKKTAELYKKPSK